MLFNSEKLMHNKLGITYDQVKTAPFADFPTVTRPMNEAEKLKMQTGVDSIYALFKRRVSAGRKLDVAMVDSIAQGRVWSGTEALKIGLVDGLGNLDRAIKSAAAKAKLKDYAVVTYPEPVDKLEKILKKFEKNSSAQATLRAAVKEELGNNHLDWLKDMSRLMKNNGKVQMAMPFSLEIK
jgi:protease-4